MKYYIISVFNIYFYTIRSVEKYLKQNYTLIRRENTVKKILLFILLSTFSYAQDSLYLVNALVGDTINKIIYAKGAGDINGDGYADLVVSYTDSVKIFLGNENFELIPDYSFGNNNGFVLCPGDVNNDGYADLLIGEKKYSTGFYDHISNINLFFGGNTLDSCKTFSYSVKYLDQVFSKQVEKIGDVNGDGYNDFAISAPYNWSNGISYVFIYLGGDTISSEPFVTFTHSPWNNPNSESTYGTTLSGIGDVNNDGYDDILIGDPGYADTVGATSSGRVYLYYGGAEMDSIADTILVNNNEIRYGWNVVNVGDLNNDNIADFVISGYNSLDIYLGLYGKLIRISPFYGSSHGISGGNINNDLYNDLLIGEQIKNEIDEWIGKVSCYIGSIDFDSTPDYTIISERPYTQFADNLDFISDFNGDDYDDFVVVAQAYPDYENQIGKLYLYSYKNYTSIDKRENSNNKEFKLYQNYPNPFNPTTVISYKISKPVSVQIKIFDINGKLVRTLLNKKQNSGNYDIIWDGQNDKGVNVSTGVYFCQLIAEDNILSKKMLLLR